MAKSSKTTTTRRGTSPKYEYSPLVEVIFEVRFPGEPAVECHRDRFFNEIRDDFPTVWVPHVEPGKPLSMQPYHFKTNDGSESVMVAINRFAYSARRYEGFEAFRPHALSLVKKFCGKYGIKKLSRTGLRYVNVIPFLRSDDLVPWTKYFTVNLAMPESSMKEVSNVALVLESRSATGKMTTRIACGKSEDETQEVFILDFDFSKTKALDVSKIPQYLDESHEHTKKVFEGVVSESYKAVMRGEVIG